MSSANIKKAIDAVGGATKASTLLGVSNWTIHSWMRTGRVPNIDLAAKLAQHPFVNMNVVDLRPLKE